MNLSYHTLLDNSFPPSARVWIYQASRLFTLSEAFAIEEKLNRFVAGWQSHGDPVRGAAYLFFGQFIILMADETEIGVGGCSTDSSVRMIRELEQEFAVSLFDRNNLAFVIEDKIELIPLSQFNYAMENGFIRPETLYFNNVVLNKEDLEKNWIIPVKDSWLARRIPDVQRFKGSKVQS